jgi:hypothetical protein
MFAVTTNGRDAALLAERVKDYVGETAWIQVVQAG